MDTDELPLRERIQLAVAALLAVGFAVFVILSAPEKVVPLTRDGRPGSFTSPTPWAAAPLIEVSRSPASTGEQNVRVRYVVTRLVDGKPVTEISPPVEDVLEAGAISVELQPEVSSFPTTRVETGAVVEWFSGEQRLGWSSVGLSDPSPLLD
ncbi:MAG: hypothetical protein NTX33_17360 [Propionibacteriales bacterium]|nr:hypothetical protein [Propionibacteriales bacterium]